MIEKPSNHESNCSPPVEDDWALLQSGDIIRLTPEQQLAFWQALQKPIELTPNQRELGRIMRGEI